METVLALVERYRSLNLSQAVGYDKFNHYAITHHSTHIEGSTLTEIETQLLLDEGQTPGGKPLAHSLMVKDHYEALQFVLSQAKDKRKITPDFIQQINALVLKNTGSLYKTLPGDVDSAQGQYRLSNVRAGNRYFVDYSKVPALAETLCARLTEELKKAATVEAQLLLSFDAHFDLVSIHPFYDGNGRTARLLMNYLQAWFGLPLAIVFTEDKADYFESLEQSRREESLAPFRAFMSAQYEKHLNTEIRRYLDAQNPTQKDGGFSLVF